MDSDLNSSVNLETINTQNANSSVSSGNSKLEEVNFENFLKASNLNANSEESDIKEPEKMTMDTQERKNIVISSPSTTTITNISNVQSNQNKDVPETSIKSSTSISTVMNTITSTIITPVNSKTAGSDAITVPSVTAAGNSMVATTGTAIKTSSGQVVIIKGTGGTPLPIRIATASSGVSSNSNTTSTALSTTSTSNSANNTGTSITSPGKQAPPVIQVLKMPDGSFVHVKTNKTLNLTNLTGKKITTASGSSAIVVKTTNSTAAGKLSALAAGSGGSISTQIIKSITVSGNEQKLGILKTYSSEDKHKFSCSPTSTSSGTVTTSSSSAHTSLTTGTKPIQSKIILPEKEILVKSVSESGGTIGNSKQVHLLKLSPTSSGSIQAIQIPGKPGVQYVRLVNSSGNSSSSGSQKIATQISGSRSGSSAAQILTGTTQKMVVVPRGSESQKIIVTTKPKSLSGGATLATIASSTSNDSRKNIKQIITTVPTLRKISDVTTAAKAFSILNKGNEGSINKQSIVKPKITELNQQIKKLCPPGQAVTTSSNTLRTIKMEASKLLNANNLGLNGQSTTTLKASPPLEETPLPSVTTPSKRLYSVLKPSEKIQDLEMSSIYHSSPRKQRSLSPEAIRRKHCNCTKSQCLKLYCDCFANGEFCQDCNCKDCFNNLQNEDERQRAIRNCLERNPNAFKPKITKSKEQSDLRLHNKGCNCKRSGCLKNYCECYEAKIACSSNCKCLGCRNVEDRSDVDQLDVSKITHSFGRGVTTKRRYEEISGAGIGSGIVSNSSAPSSSAAGAGVLSFNTGSVGAAANDSMNAFNNQTSAQGKPYNFITQDVIDATIQCMLAQADECKKSGLNTKSTERMILEELGRCLVEIIDFSIRNMVN